MAFSNSTSLQADIRKPRNPISHRLICSSISHCFFLLSFTQCIASEGLGHLELREIRRNLSEFVTWHKPPHWSKRGSKITDQLPHLPTFPPLQFSRSQYIFSIHRILKTHVTHAHRVCHVPASRSHRGIRCSGTRWLQIFQAATARTAVRTSPLRDKRGSPPFIGHCSNATVKLSPDPQMQKQHGIL